MTPNTQIGQAIRKARVKAGLSQAALGELIGKDRKTIWAYEQGHISIAATTLDSIAHELGVSINSLLATGRNVTARNKSVK